MAFLKFLFSIEGRLRRREYWLSVFVLVALIANRIGQIRDTARAAHVYSNTVTDAYLINLLTRSDTSYATLALLLLIGWTLTAKRFHDRGRSGVYAWAILVPAIGWAWMAWELIILPGTDGANRYGPHPTFGIDEAPESLRIRSKR